MYNLRICGRFMVRGLFISTLISLTGFLAVDAAGMDEAVLRADTKKNFKEKVLAFRRKILRTMPR